MLNAYLIVNIRYKQNIFKSKTDSLFSFWLSCYNHKRIYWHRIAMKLNNETIIKQLIFSFFISYSINLQRYQGIQTHARWHDWLNLYNQTCQDRISREIGWHLLLSNRINDHRVLKTLQNSIALTNNNTQNIHEHAEAGYFKEMPSCFQAIQTS